MEKKKSNPLEKENRRLKKELKQVSDELNTLRMQNIMHYSALFIHGMISRGKTIEVEHITSAISTASDLVQFIEGRNV